MLFVLLWGSLAYGVEGDVDDALNIVENQLSQPSFEDVRRYQASLEVQIALRLYADFDDFRAITAIKRWMILDGTQRAEGLGSLMVGQIYRRNQRPMLAIRSFENAARNMPDDQRIWAHLMATQEVCIPLDAYIECHKRLTAIADAPMTDEQREVLDYQLLFTEVVLRQRSVNANSAAVFAVPELKTKAEGLIRQNQAFEELPTKSPALAGIMSIIPGLGHVYNGRYIDALLAMTLTGGSGALTWYTWDRYRSVPWTAVLGTVTLGFYVGNIVNAVVDARHINTELYRAFFDALKSEYWPYVVFDIDEDAVHFRWEF